MPKQFLSTTKPLPLLLFLLGLMVSCKKEPERLPAQIPEAFARRYIFRTGSWWAYRDSATGQVDTLRVDTAWVWIGGLSTQYKNENQKQQSVNAYFEHSRIGRITTRNRRYDDRRPYTCSWDQALGGYSFALGFDIAQGPVLYRGQGADNIKLLDSTATLQIGPTTIDSIHVFALDSTKWQNQLIPVFKETWWAKDIGLVRYRLATGETYTLQSWHATPFWPLP